MPVVITRPEWFTIDSVPSATPGWEHRHVLPFREEFDQRGSDIIIPGSAGTLPQKRRRTVTLRAIPIQITGEKDQNDADNADPLAGLEANIDYLMAQWVAPTGATDGTRTLVWHRRNGTTKTAKVHVLGMPLTDEGGYMVSGVLKLSFPLAVWT